MLQFLSDNLVLIAIAFISGGMLIWPLVRSRAAGPTLTTLQVTQLINSKHAVVVDVRAPDEFAKGSLPNARNLPSETLEARAGELKKDKPVVVVCPNGKQAGRAAAQLRGKGIAEVYVLGGGIAAWREAGLPLRT